MGRRLKLHKKLCHLLGSCVPQAEQQVYFQPPENLKIYYPCIIYEEVKIDAEYANNRLYRKMKQYSITVIDEDPDSIISETVMEGLRCRYDRHYTADNLHHTVLFTYH